MSQAMSMLDTLHPFRNAGWLRVGDSRLVLREHNGTWKVSSMLLPGGYASRVDDWTFKHGLHGHSDPQQLHQLVLRAAAADDPGDIIRRRN